MSEEYAYTQVLGRAGRLSSDQSFENRRRFHCGGMDDSESEWLDV
jgi:hypothetical protein